MKHSVAGDFVFRAIGMQELPLALYVRKAVYVDELGYDASRVLRDPLDERAQHFIASARDGSPVAAMRIIRRDACLLELESFLDIAALLSNGSRPGEISRLCILEKYRNLTRSQFVHAGMWKLAYDYALHCGLTEFWIWAPPPLVKAYEYLGFGEVPGMVFEHPLFGNKPYQVLRVDLRSLEDDYRKRRHSLSEFLFGVPLEPPPSEVGPGDPENARNG